MTDQNAETKRLDAQGDASPAASKPADDRIAPGVSGPNKSEDETTAATPEAKRPSTRRLSNRAFGAVAACAVALVAVLAGVGYATGLFGVHAEQAAVTAQQEESGQATVAKTQASSSSDSTAQTQGDSQSDNKSADEKSDAASGAEAGGGETSSLPATRQAKPPLKRKLPHPTQALLQVRSLRLLPAARTKSPHPNPLLLQNLAPSRSTSASIARAPRRMASAASATAQPFSFRKAQRSTTPCAPPAPPFPAARITSAPSTVLPKSNAATEAAERTRSTDRFRARPADATRSAVAKASPGSTPPKKTRPSPCRPARPCKLATPYSIAIIPPSRLRTVGCCSFSPWPSCNSCTCS